MATQNATIYIEIPVKISFSVDHGQKGRFSGPPEDCWPEFPACVEDIDIDPGQILDEIRKVIFDDKSTIPEQLMEIERQKKGAAEEDAADRKYQEMKERYDEPE